MGRGPKSNLGYHVYQEDPTHHHTPVRAAIPRNASGRIDEKSLRTLPTPSPTPLRDEESDFGDESDLLEIIVPLPPLKRSASKTSHIPTGKRAKTKSSGGVPSRPAQLLATGEAPQDAASIRTRTANLMGLNKAFNSPQLSLSMTKPSIAEIPKQAIQVTTTPEDAISTTRSALTIMKSAIGKKDKASVEKHLLVAMGTLLSLYEGDFASSETGGVGEAMETDEGTSKTHSAVVEKEKKMSGKETLRTSVSGTEGIEGSSPEGKLAEPAGSLSRPRNTGLVTPSATTAPLHRQDIIIKEQENRIKVLQDNLGKVRTELSESRKQNKEWFGKVASLEQEAGNNKSDVARDIAERTIGVLKEEKRLVDVQFVQLRELLEDKRKAVLSAEAASSNYRLATDTMRITKDRLAEEIVGLKQQLQSQKAQLSIKPTASLSSAELDQLRRQKTEATREATDLKQKLRVVDKMTENAKLTREREIGDSFKKEDGLSEAIAILRSQLEARDDTIQTAKSAFDDNLDNQLRAKDLEIRNAKSAFSSELDTMRKKETRHIDEVKTLKARLQSSNCGNESKMLRNQYDQATKQVTNLKLHIKKTKLALESRSLADKLREGHQSLIDQILHIAKTVEEEAVDPKLPLDSEEPKPNPETAALNATVSKQKKQIKDQARRLIALHKSTTNGLVKADKELREGKMEDLYIQCVTDLAPIIISVKQANVAKDRTIQKLTSQMTVLKTQARISQLPIMRFDGVVPVRQSRKSHPSAPFRKPKDQERTPHAEKREEVDSRSIWERELSISDRKKAPPEQVLPKAKEVGKKGSKRTDGLEPGEIEESGESRVRAWNAIYSLDKPRGH